jgi:hypothetical protein
MNITVTVTQAELSAYQVISDIKSRFPDATIVVSGVAPPAPVTASGHVASTAPIGQTVLGYLITHYGYPGDSSPDSGSMAGKGDRDNKLTPNLSVALTLPSRQKIFETAGKSTGKEFSLEGNTFQDDDTAPESNLRIDVYDPYYSGVDEGCTPEMYAKSKAEMVTAGILNA